MQGEYHGVISAFQLTRMCGAARDAEASEANEAGSACGRITAGALFNKGWTESKSMPDSAFCSALLHYLKMNTS